MQASHTYTLRHSVIHRLTNTLPGMQVSETGKLLNKLKLSLFLSTHHIMKTYEGVQV
jgi:hypothetical protein